MKYLDNKSKFRVIESGGGGHPKVTFCVGCPYCDNEYVHIGQPDFLDGNDNYEADDDGIIRGDIIVIPMYCEFGHSWNTFFGFHKGHTFIWNDWIRKDPNDDLPHWKRGHD